MRLPANSSTRGKSGKATISEASYSIQLEHKSCRRTFFFFFSNFPPNFNCNEQLLQVGTNSEKTREEEKFAFVPRWKIDFQSKKLAWLWKL